MRFFGISCEDGSGMFVEAKDGMSLDGWLKTGPTFGTKNWSFWDSGDDVDPDDVQVPRWREESKDELALHEAWFRKEMEIVGPVGDGEDLSIVALLVDDYLYLAAYEFEAPSTLVQIGFGGPAPAMYREEGGSR